MKKFEHIYVFKRSDYESFKDMYKDIALKMDAKNDMNCIEPEDLGYHADILWEFLCDFDKESNKFIFVGFDREKIAKQKTYDDYAYNIMLSCFTDLAEKYPENVIEFVDEENEKV